MSDEAATYRFWTNVGRTASPTDARSALLAVAIAGQQRAGFGTLLDIRESHCPSCDAVGFNGGWGAWIHACGSEVLTDGEIAEPCPGTVETKPRTHFDEMAQEGSGV